ncbi:MAG: LysM peptidoglycan-binding domain-containing protein [Lachnospiraceae bacterium]|nr:LysM peptidoglycan-binding domain-containing protein [Lachnospiraceae bacterium]
MEQNKLPKNIRQIGEKEDWIRVYIEDYVHTYIQRLRGLEESGVSGGMLLGRRQRINGIMHLFIRGAVVAEDPFWRDPGQTPGQLKAESSVYFPDLEICGYFVSSRQDRSSEVDLVRIFETHFPSEYQILFNVRNQDEEAFAYSGHSLVRLAGYYIYYEKNEEMQSYIIRQESLRVLGQKNAGEMQEEFSSGEMKKTSGKKMERAGKIGDRFEKAGKTSEKTGNRSEKTGKRIIGIPGRDRPGGNEGSGESGEKERRMAAGAKPSAGKKMKKGDLVVRIVSVAGIFILAFLLFSDQIKFNKVDETTADSSGLLSSILNESSMVQAGADSSYIETGSSMEAGSGNSDTASGVNGENSVNGESVSGAESSAGEESSKNESDTGSAANSNQVINGDEKEENSGSAESSGKENEAGSGQEGAAADGSVSQKEGSSGSDENNDNTGKEVSSFVFPMRYLVKKGDSLYSICEKYYGDTGMVDAVCLENNISDPSKLQYGVVLTLPER